MAAVLKGNGVTQLYEFARFVVLYSSVTNKMQRYTVIFITVNALHVSDGSPAHHQELKTVYIASGICRAVIVLYTRVNKNPSA